MNRTPCIVRKTNPRVIGGSVQKKNHDGATDDFWRQPQPFMRLERRKPGPGFAHTLGIQHLSEFIEIIPNWEELGRGLDAVVLATGEPYKLGQYNYGWTKNGFIFLRAWPSDFVREWSDKFLESEKVLMERLGVRRVKEEFWWRMEFTERQARAYVLMDVFLHEIGHHQDRVRSKAQVECGNGEPYAERFAKELAEQMWPRFSRLYDRW